MADTEDLKSFESNLVSVRVRSAADHSCTGSSPFLNWKGFRFLRTSVNFILSIGELRRMVRHRSRKPGPRKGLAGSSPALSAFGPPKRTYGVTKSAKRFAKVTFAMT